MAYTTDPVADLLTRIRNANNANHDSLMISSSNLKANIVDLLHKEGFILKYNLINKLPQDELEIFLKYGSKREKVITNLKRISKPGLRVYCNKENIPLVMGGLGIAILSTSQGLMTDRDARKKGIGGEVLAYIW